MSDLIGNEIPNETLVFMDKDKGPQPLKILDFCKGKKIVSFGVPGAFTPTCARNHLPGFIENAEKIKEGHSTVNYNFIMKLYNELSQDQQIRLQKTFGTAGPSLTKTG